MTHRSRGSSSIILSLVIYFITIRESGMSERFYNTSWDGVRIGCKHSKVDQESAPVSKAMIFLVKRL